LLPLNEFGYYTLAATIAAAMSAVVSPFFNALYPRFSRLVATCDEKNLIALYHQSNQLLAVLVASVAAVLVFFSDSVLRLWTHDTKLVSESHSILSILVIGTALNGLMNIPYALQLAYGWTRLALYQNLVAILIVVPSMWWLGHRYGGIGAAAVWASLNFGYVSVGIPLMHRRLLRQEMYAWYWRDVLPPVVTAMLIAGAFRLVIPLVPGGPSGIALVMLIGLITLGSSALVTPATRSLVRGTLVKIISKY
jgi:O-antigen/teichoic acid export membrane protein